MVYSTRKLWKGIIDHHLLVEMITKQNKILVPASVFKYRKS